MNAGLQACWVENWSEAMSVVKMSGSKLDGVDGEGWCMMHHAVWHERKDLLLALLNAGANPEIKDSEDLTPGTLACVKGRWALAQSVAAAGRKLDAQDKDGWTMLHYAAAHGQEALASALLANGADASLVDAERLTPGLAACAKEQWGTALLLANHGAALGAQDEDGSAMLHYAVDSGQRELLASLIRGEAPLGSRDAKGLTPVDVALGTQAGRWALPELIRAGARVDAPELARAGLGSDGAVQATQAPRRLRG